MCVDMLCRHVYAHVCRHVHRHVYNKEWPYERSAYGHVCRQVRGHVRGHLARMARMGICAGACIDMCIGMITIFDGCPCNGFSVLEQAQTDMLFIRTY